MIILAVGDKPIKYAAGQSIKKDSKVASGLYPLKVSAVDIFSRFKALKLSECLSEFNFFKRRGYDYRMVLAVLVSTIVVSPKKTINYFLTSLTGEGSFIGVYVLYGHLPRALC